MLIIGCIRPHDSIATSLFTTSPAVQDNQGKRLWPAHSSPPGPFDNAGKSRCIKTCTAYQCTVYFGSFMKSPQFSSVTLPPYVSGRHGPFSSCSFLDYFPNQCSHLAGVAVRCHKAAADSPDRLISNYKPLTCEDPDRIRLRQPVRATVAACPARTSFTHARMGIGHAETPSLPCAQSAGPFPQTTAAALNVPK